MEKKTSLSIKLNSFIESHPFLSICWEFLLLAEQHAWCAGILVTLLTTLCSFFFRQIYHEILQGYLNYYGFASSKLSVLKDDVLGGIFETILLVGIVIVASLIFLAIFYGNAPKLLKFFHLIMLLVFYCFCTFLSITLTLQKVYSLSFLYLFFFAQLVIFITLESFFAFLRDFIGTHVYNTHRKIRSFFFLILCIAGSLAIFITQKLGVNLLPFISLYFMYSLIISFLFLYVLLLHPLFTKKSPTWLDQMVIKLSNFCIKRNFPRFIKNFINCGRQLFFHEKRLLSILSIALVPVLILFLFPMINSLFPSFGKTSALLRHEFITVKQYQNQDWAVVYETSEKFYLAPVKIDYENDHLQFLSAPGQIVSNENLLLKQETFAQVSPPDVS